MVLPPVERAAPVIDLDEYYVETAFGLRLRGVFEEAEANRTWHFAWGPSGAGKTREIDELRARRPITRDHSGKTHAPVLTGEPAQGSRLGAAVVHSLANDLGTNPRGNRLDKRLWLARELVNNETTLIVFDETHGMIADDLREVKDVTDLARKMPGGRKIGVVFVGYAIQGAPPLYEIVNRQTAQWVQFRRRLSPTEPWQYVPALSAAEVRAALLGYERKVLAPLFPRLHVARWSPRIYKHLIHPFFDLEGSERVTMQNVRNVVDGILRRIKARGLDDVPDDGTLIDGVVAELLAAPKTVVVGAGPESDDRLADAG